MDVRRREPETIPTSARRVQRLRSYVAASLILKHRGLDMNCKELAGRIESLQPGADPRDVARLCLLLTNATADVSRLEDECILTQTWREMGMKLQAATDQHAAMTEELEQLARSDPHRFTPDQIWVLIRAIKVQSQILQLYVGQATLGA